MKDYNGPIVTDLYGALLQFSPGLFPYKNHTASTQEYFVGSSSELHTAHQPAIMVRRGLDHFKMLQSQVRANLINQRKGKLFQKAAEGKKGRGNRVMGIHLPTAGFSGSHAKFAETEWVTDVYSPCLVT